MARVEAKELRLGYVDFFGEHVSLSHENGCYHVRRHPAHPCGHWRYACRTLKEARAAAYRAASQKPTNQE